MTDSFMQNHQSALDSFMEDKAIQDLEDAGIYPVPDNDGIYERLYEEEVQESLDKLLQKDFQESQYYLVRDKYQHLLNPG